MKIFTMKYSSFTQRNSFDPADPLCVQLNEIMSLRDPFYRQSQSATPSKDQLKVRIAISNTFISYLKYGIVVKFNSTKFSKIILQRSTPVLLVKMRKRNVKGLIYEI